ncbi:MAG: SAM-dependent methyltransferase [Balneolaceae bacterium]
MSTLYLIPVPIGKRKENLTLPEHTLETIRSLNCFIVENNRHALSLFQWVGHPIPPYEMELRILNKKTPEHEIFSYLELLKTRDTGLFSEAGAPGVADPGSTLVKIAHDNGIRVTPLVGPSSILLALMASGMNGQSFTFHGYLPVQERDRAGAIRNLEQESRQLNRTQIFMETPHRNEPMLQSLLKTCNPDTRLAIACNLTMPDELILSMPVHKWRKSKKPDIQGKPALFLINSGRPS